MWKIGFNEKWTSLVMNCVRSTSLSILINSILGDTFMQQSGLKQGILFSYICLLYVCKHCQQIGGM